MMNASLRPDSKCERQLRWGRLPVIGLLALFVVVSALLPSRVRSARTAPVKRTAAMNASAKSVAPPLAPVRISRFLDDEIIIEGGPTIVTCGGASCYPQSMYCSQTGAYIVMMSGCCAKCCFSPDNCSTPTCCDARP